MIHDVIDHKDNYCHKLLGEHFSSQRKVMWVSVDNFNFSDSKKITSRCSMLTKSNSLSGPEWK